jgi:hypothetical protein
LRFSCAAKQWKETKEMKISSGEQAANYKQATSLAFQDAGAGDISVAVADLLVSLVDATKLSSEAEKSITAAIRGKYGAKPTWQGKWWYVPVPTLSYEARDIPQLKIESKAYLVAVIEIETTDDSYSVTMAGTIGKAVTLTVPMVFLRAILDDDLGRFSMLSKSSSHTTWEIPGAKPVQLPNDFVNKLTEIFKRKSVGMWLSDFGRQSKSVTPLVVGSLLGLQFQATARPVPLAQQSCTPENLLATLEAMAYPKQEAREMVRRASPDIRADNTLEEGVRIVLRQVKGE